MLHTHMGMLLFFIQLFCYAQFSSANSSLITKDKQTNKIQINQQPSFIINLPHITTIDIIQKIYHAKSVLNKRRLALSKTEKNRRFNAKDGAISLILPGGLLYAAIIKLRHDDIKKQLHNISKQLNELSLDLIALKSVHSSNTLVAALD